MIYLTSSLALRLLQSSPRPTLSALCQALSAPGVTLEGPWAARPAGSPPRDLEALNASDWSE